MKKLLRPKDLLFLGLAGFLDVFEVARDPFGIAADSCKNLYGWVPEKYKRHNFIRLVERNLKTGEIEKVIKNGEAYLRLTTAGKEKTVRDFPMFSLQKKKWDGKWRMVIFDIAEVSRKIRDLLRCKLKELGFGMLQKSIWTTPHDMIVDLRQFLKEKGLGEDVYVFEVAHLLAGDPKDLADKIWKLDKLNDDYKNILDGIKSLKQMYIIYNDRVKKYQAKVTDEKISNDNDEKTSKVVLGMKDRFSRKTKGIVNNLKKNYLDILFADPCLPKELLPNDWVGDLVKAKIKTLINS